jgi:Xaa-Pro aminopeptidase
MPAPAKNRVKQLRALMAEAGVDAYLVPSTDPHQSEYVPACWQRRQWLSGFSGSAGDVLVTRSMAGLWTDGRYFLQATEELKGSGIKLFKQGNPGVPTISQWLSKNLQPGQTLGADPRVLSRAVAAELQTALQRAGAKLKALDRNLVDQLWSERPAPSPAPLELLPKAFTGQTVTAKLRLLRKAMAENKAAAHVLTALDAIAWLFNVRSADVDYNPVAIAYAVVTPEAALLFTAPQKVDDKVRAALARCKVELHTYAEVSKEIRRLKQAKARVWVDGGSVNQWVLGKLKGCELVTEPSPIGLMKAKKNAAEIAGSQAAHLRDGVAMARFLCWLEGEVPRGGVSELSAAERLAAFRAEGEHFRGESFEAIVGYGAHGAIIHYGATPETDAPLRAKGILLVDSGGQYLDGTTDITRTVLLGAEASAEQRDRFTRVLKGHIAISRCRFPAGTAGRQIDTLARSALWSAGLNYNHGTGHGVGAYLSVHEGPQSISPVRCTGVPLEAGNILSNEPGYYKEGQYGIRLENLVRVVADEKLSAGGDLFLTFDELTLCPFDSRLVERALLTAEERAWLNDYHTRVREALEPLLPAREVRWLRRATKRV